MRYSKNMNSSRVLNHGLSYQNLSGSHYDIFNLLRVLSDGLLLFLQVHGLNLQAHIVLTHVNAC